MRSLLKENEEICVKIEYGVISLRKELENSNAQLHKSLKSTKYLNEILSYQRSPFIKKELGYDENHKTLK